MGDVGDYWNEHREYRRARRLRPDGSPNPKPYHMARLVDEQGNVSPLCASTPRKLDLRRETWTNRPEAVTCKNCLEALRRKKVSMRKTLIVSVLFLFVSILQAGEPVAFTIEPESVTVPVTGDDDSVTVCVTGLAAGQRVGVNMPMRYDASNGATVYQQQATPVFDGTPVCFVFPIPGTALDLPAQAKALLVPVFVQSEKGGVRQIKGPALVVTGPDEGADGKR